MFINIVADIDDGDITVYVRGINLIYADAGSRTYYHFNAHGDVVVLTNASGNKTKSYSYNAFGVEYSEATLDDNPFRYCGEYYDKETQTIYLRARYYNTKQGRFTQQDGWEFVSCEEPLSLNLYTYCRNNPIIFIDPNGNMWQVVPALDPRTRLYGGGSGNSDGRSHAAAYESSAYNTYRIKSTTALYDAQLGGYHSNNLSSGITNPSAYIVPGAETVDDSFAIVKKSKETAKQSPNPNGRKGGEEHQAAIKNKMQNLEDEGYTNIRNEECIPTQGGQKVRRFVDIAADKDGITHYFQVGRSNPKGAPNTYEGAVIRERRAIDDLVEYGKIDRNHIHFITYYKKEK